MVTPPQRARRALQGHPLPVHHRVLWCWYYPAIASGELRLEAWTQQSMEAGDIEVLAKYPLGPFGGTRPLRYVSDRWAHEVASLTQWPEFLGAFPAPSMPAGGV